jgi:CHAD domain-containing protein
MGYQLKRREKLPAGIHRIARKQALVISRHLGKSRPQDEFESIHEARIGIKRMRSLLRLVRKKLGDQFYHRQNSALRAIGHSLSPLRDPEVQIKTLQKLRQDCLRNISEKELSHLQNELSQEQEKNPGAATSSKKNWQADLHSILRVIEQWPLKGLKHHHLRSGIKRATRRFRKARKTAKKAPTDRNLHEWRKQTKNLYYQLATMEKISPKAVGILAHRLKHLGEILGDDHDLALLDGKLESARPCHLESLRSVIRFRRAELQESALKTGRRLHKESAIL